jgi:hypothetical protein
MAAKAPAAKKAAVAPVAKKSTVTKARARGLQLTTAQWAAYNKAYNATASAARRSLALASGAARFRRYRLNAAYASMKRYAVARGNAQAAAVAANAARMTWAQSRLAHQNSALQARIELDMYTHANLAGRLQYAAAGEKAYANDAVMRTLDNAQAVAHEAAVFRQIEKTASKASKSALPKRKYKASAAVTAAARKAGLAAATTPALARSARVARAKRKAASHAKASATAKASARKSARSRKAPVKAAKSRTAPLHPLTLGNDPAAYAVMQAAVYGASPLKKTETRREWVGDEVTPNCVITAVANHLLYSKGVTATERAMNELYESCKPEPIIEEVLWTAWVIGWPCDGCVRLRTYKLVAWETALETLGGPIVGFEVQTEEGPRDHAALSLAGGNVVSWGSVTKREAPVEEAWELWWES